MSTMYRWIKALGEVFDGGLDDNGRAVALFNVTVTKAVSATFERELVKLLQDASIGTFGTSLFAGSKAALPPTGTFVAIVATPGQGPELKHNTRTGVAYQRPNAQIRAHADTYEAAVAKAHAAYAALTVVKNQAVTAA